MLLTSFMGTTLYETFNVFPTLSKSATAAVADLLLTTEYLMVSVFTSETLFAFQLSVAAFPAPVIEAPVTTSAAPVALGENVKLEPVLLNSTFTA